MERGIPSLQSDGEGVLSYSIYDKDSFTERCGPFFLVVGIAILICVLIFVFAKVNLTGALVVLGFLIAWTWVAFEVLFSAWYYEFDGNQSEIRITRRVYGRKPKRKIVSVTSSHTLFIFVSRDENDDCYHNVFLKKSIGSYFVLRIASRESDRKDGILRFVDRLANLYGINNQGYVSIYRYMWRLFTFRIWFLWFCLDPTIKKFDEPRE